MKKIIVYLAMQLMVVIGFGQVVVKNPLTENQKNPLGLDVTPRFSWQLVSAKRNVMQSAYEIRVSDASASLSKGNLWSSGKVNSDQSLFVEYSGKPLQSGKKYYWQVRVYDQTGKASPWSEVFFLANGIIERCRLESKMDSTRLSGRYHQST